MNSWNCAILTYAGLSGKKKEDFIRLSLSLHSSQSPKFQGKTFHQYKSITHVHKDHAVHITYRINATRYIRCP